MLVDFLVEIQLFEPLEKEVMTYLEEKMKWVLNTDEASNKNGAGIGLVLENSSGVLIEEALRMEKNLTNNKVEYEALLYGLELALKLGAQYLEVNLDSKLITGQLIGTFVVKDPRMNSYCEKARSFLSQFKDLKIKAIKRKLNSQADALAKGVAYREYS